ncbi:S16 family serine protease [Thermoflavimicrobium daqui]|nr:S16 family serine protease [Thermoflavimicrobium daqui]
MKKLLISIVILVLLGIASIYIPIPGYMVITPGEMLNTKEMIQVDQGTKSKGDYYITSFEQGPANAISYLFSFTGIIKVEPMPPLDEQKMDVEKGKADLENSKLSAMTAAIRKAGKDVKYEHKGWEVLKDDTKYGIKKGDLLQAIDGISLKSSEEFFLPDLIKYYEKKKVGDTVTYQILRGEETLEVKTKLVEQNGQKIDDLNLRLSVKQKAEFQSPVKVNFKKLDLGGPSAGLMMTLDILDELLPEDLTKGNKIAGTGTISADGKVGIIGGENYKVLSTIDTGVKVFFCPKENAKLAQETVKKYDIKVKVVPVATLDEAVEYLRNMK